MPIWYAASVSAPAPSRAASCANVVLQERANAVRSGTVPRSKSWSLGTVRSPIVVVAGQATGESSVTALDCSAADAVTILKVEPGGERPGSERAPCALA